MNRGVGLGGVFLELRLLKEMLVYGIGLVLRRTSSRRFVSRLLGLLTVLTALGFFGLVFTFFGFFTGLTMDKSSSSTLDSFMATICSDDEGEEAEREGSCTNRLPTGACAGPSESTSGASISEVRASVDGGGIP